MGVYKNAMELLVEEEVTRQHKALPDKTAAFVNPTQLIAYALNQLPSLYATSEKGLDHQLQRGKAKYSTQIAQAVQRSIAAVLRDPLRTHPPLQSHTDHLFQDVLHRLRLLLRNDKIDWESLPTAVEQALHHGEQSERNSRYHAARTIAGHAALRRSSPFPQEGASSDRSTHSEQSTRSTPPDSNPRDVDIFGWDDPLYHSR